LSAILVSTLAPCVLAKLPRSALPALLAAFDRNPMRPGVDEVAPSLTLVYPFPNYAIALLRDVGYWYEVQPVAAGRITLKTHLLFSPDLVERVGLAGRVAAHEAFLRLVHLEDVEVCASVQRGVQAGSSRAGSLSVHEKHNRTFARWYASAITGRSHRVAVEADRSSQDAGVDGPRRRQ
jgi:hypothetical protein